MRSCASSDSTFTAAAVIPEPAQRTRTCIIVAGMHRSGTSATTRVVNLLGADIASDLMPSVPGVNDRGFWESMTTYELHNGLLHRLGSGWDDPYPLIDAWLETEATRDAKRAILGHIEKEFNHSKMFVVKDPRVTRLLPLWLEAFDELSITPIVVIPFRNPIEVAGSLERRDGFPPAKSLLGCIQANLEVERASRGRDRLFHLYDDLISDWRPFAEKLARIGGADLKALSPETCVEIDDFLSKDLRHHRATRDSLASLPDAAAMLVEMYDRMVEAASTGAEGPLRACFDRVRERIWEMAKLYRAVAAAQDKDYRKEVARLERKMTAESQRHDAELGAFRSQLGQSNTRVEELTTQLRQRDARGEELTAQLHQRDARVEELTTQLHQREARLNELAGELREREAAMEELRAQVVTLETKVMETMRSNVLASEQISSLLRSTSWRVTAPLRALGRLGRAVQRRARSFRAG